MVPVSLPSLSSLTVTLSLAWLALPSLQFLVTVSWVSLKPSTRNTQSTSPTRLAYLLSSVMGTFRSTVNVVPSPL